jgi:lipoyl(octanoyl) transferase
VSECPALQVARLGVVRYAEALELQRAVARARIDGSLGSDVLLLLEHPPVVTLGRSSKEKHLLAGPELLAARGIELFEVERGGDVTFHGPGQLVGYPIVDLKQHRKDLHWYLRQVEEALIMTLARFGIAAERNAGLTGVWTQGRKIASIGVHARDWVTWHGFALNVTTDLSYFVPCGIPHVTMTSVARELGRAVSLSEAEEAAAHAFGAVFDRRIESIPPDAIQTFSAGLTHPS